LNIDCYNVPVEIHRRNDDEDDEEEDDTPLSV
jgi:hypothetical protein